MKKTYIVPIVCVDEAEMDGLLMVTSIHLSEDSGNEEYVKEYDTKDETIWDVEW